MKRLSVLMVGCGEIGIRVGSSLSQQGWKVAAVRRDTTKLPAAFIAHAADYTVPGNLDFAESLAPDFVVATFSPFDRTAEGYRTGFYTAMQNLLRGLGGHRPRHIIMSSSTRVFAERDGGWVDEQSPLTTTDESAQAIIAAEQHLLGSGLGASVVRFGGIYGNPGGRLLARISRGQICPSRPVRYTNRIHREDCAGFIDHLLQAAAAGKSLSPIYIGVDDMPAPRFEVESWLADKLGVAVEQGEDQIQHNSAGHKRCANKALHASGYRLKYPDYRSGYRALLGL
tara:strand:+ start:1966 stop:2817 length:852 start_codon:yes stop_codon:yes gene_type:complete